MAGATQCTTGKVRFSYVKVFNPEQQDDGSMRYSVTLLIPKSDTATVQKLKACMKAAQDRYSERHNGTAAPKKHSLHDGDGNRPSDDEPYTEEYHGHWCITVSSKDKPVIIDRDKTPITDRQELYSGCYGRAVINAYCYDTKGKKGISFGLNGLMKLHDGEPLGGAVVTDADWDDDFDYSDAGEAVDNLLD